MTPASDRAVQAVCEAFQRYTQQVAIEHETSFKDRLQPTASAAEDFVLDLVKIDGLVNTPAVSGWFLNHEPYSTAYPIDSGVVDPVILGHCHGAYLGSVMIFFHLAQKLGMNSFVAAAEEVRIAKHKHLTDAIQDLRHDVEACKQADVFTNRVDKLVRSIEKFSHRLSCDRELLAAEEGVDWVGSTLRHETTEIFSAASSCFSEVQGKLFSMGLATGFPTGIGVFLRTWIGNYQQGYVPLSN